VCGPLYLKLPVYLQEKNYESPRDPRKGLFQAHKECDGATIFEYYSKPEHKEEAVNFYDFVAAYAANRTQWVDVYKTSHIIDGYTGGPLLVDVGGNLGRDLEAFTSRHPGYESQLFLQDIPQVIGRAECDSRIHRVPHNFFEPQPIEGARAYYLHSIIHDWNDDDALLILRQIARVMKPGYSKLLINDIMLPSVGTNRLETSVDMQMMIMVSGIERREETFHRMFEEAGLEVVQIWRNPSSVTSIFECIMPEIVK
jgi:hypothetical protein